MSSGEDDGGEQAEEESDEQTCEPRELFSLGQLSTDGQLSTECQKARGGERGRRREAQAIRSWKNRRD